MNGIFNYYTEKDYTKFVTLMITILLIFGMVNIILRNPMNLILEKFKVIDLFYLKIKYKLLVITYSLWNIIIIIIKVT